MCDFYSRLHKLVNELSRDKSLSLLGDLEDGGSNERSSDQDPAQLALKHPAHITHNALPDAVDIPRAPSGSLFGRHLIDQGFLKLAPDTTLVNNGSYGTCPDPVLTLQDQLRARLEERPTAFNADVELAQARVLHHLGKRQYGTTCEHLVFTLNATAGVQSVIQGVMREGEVLVMFDAVYAGVRDMARRLATRHKFTIETLRMDLPVSHTQIIAKVKEALESVKNVRLFLIDHITAVAASIMPVRAIAELCRAKGVLNVVDGAHSTGQIPTNLPQLGCDFYAGNLYKWGFAPKSTGILYARDKDHFDMLDPCILSHQADYKGCGLVKFGWLSCCDYTGWLAAAMALRVIEAFGGKDMYDRNHDLCVRAAVFLVNALKPVAHLVVGDPVSGSDEPCKAPQFALIPSMATISLDTEISATDMISRLRDEFRIVAFVMRYHTGELMLRISAAVFNEPEDYVKLANAMRKILDVDGGGPVSEDEIARFKAAEGGCAGLWLDDESQ